MESITQMTDRADGIHHAAENLFLQKDSENNLFGEIWCFWVDKCCSAKKEGVA